MINDLDDMPDLALGPGRILRLPEDVPMVSVWPRLDFWYFGEQIAVVGLLIRITLAAQIARDATFSEKVMKAYSATARLRAIEKVLLTETVEVG